MTIRQILQFFIRYKYQAIFPVAVAEGPIITIISGFLVSRGRLELIPALAVVFLGDIVSDTAFYYVGRGGRWMIGFLKLTHVSPERIELLENQFIERPWRTMIVAKISYGLGSIFMIASGASKMKLKSFFEYIVGLDFIRSSILLSIGFYFGRVALNSGPIYLKYYAALAIIIVPTTYFVYRKKQKK